LCPDEDRRRLGFAPKPQVCTESPGPNLNGWRLEPRNEPTDSSARPKRSWRDTIFRAE
jgi:hypothetical protein